MIFKLASYPKGSSSFDPRHAEEVLTIVMGIEIFLQKQEQNAYNHPRTHSTSPKRFENELRISSNKKRIYDPISGIVSTG
jgi:hypothetical protein